jgi:hypothetical protein
MNNKFDELARGLARSVTRREAFRKFGLALFGTLTASLGLGRTSAGHSKTGVCALQPDITTTTSWRYTGYCVDPAGCFRGFSSDCPQGALVKLVKTPPTLCGGVVGKISCSF